MQQYGYSHFAKVSVYGVFSTQRVLVSEYDQERHNLTLCRPTQCTARKRHRTLTSTWHQEINQSNATSSLFLRKMIAKPHALERHVWKFILSCLCVGRDLGVGFLFFISMCFCCTINPFSLLLAILKLSDSLHTLFHIFPISICAQIFFYQ